MGQEAAKMRHLLRVFAVAVFCLLCRPAAFCQSSQNTTTTNSDPNQKTPQSSQAQNLSPAEKRRADLVADTEKLYQLTQELKAEVARSNKDTLSVAVVKKAQEVERLAKSIKERSRSQ